MFKRVYVMCRLILLMFLNFCVEFRVEALICDVFLMVFKLCFECFILCFGTCQIQAMSLFEKSFFTRQLACWNRLEKPFGKQLLSRLKAHASQIYLKICQNGFSLFSSLRRSRKSQTTKGPTSSPGWRPKMLQAQMRLGNDYDCGWLWSTSLCLRPRMHQKGPLEPINCLNRSELLKGYPTSDFSCETKWSPWIAS